MRNKDKFYMADSFDRGATMNWMAEDYDAVSALNSCASAATHKDISTAIEGITGQGTSSNCYGYTANNLSVKADNGNWAAVSSINSISDRMKKLEKTVRDLLNKRADSRWDSDLRSRLLTLGGSV